MMTSLKLAILAFSRAMGLFHLARWVTRKRIRILCYHGISTVDEHRFRPALFMRESTFRSRLETLRDGRYEVIPLDAAVEKLESGHPPARASVVITFDDGFRRTGDCAFPMLAEFGMPATVYVTSYYSARETPIPTLAVQYMLWRTECTKLQLGSVLEDCGQDVNLEDPEAARGAVEHLMKAMRAMESEDERQALLDHLGEILDVPTGQIRSDGRLSLMDSASIHRAGQAGVDIQLHTHRHVLPLDADGARREIDDNKAFLEPLTTSPLEHFCYPSGEWDRRHWPALKSSGVRSATTCVPGMNDINTPRMALHRFVDQEDVHPLEFEAEISGFAGAFRMVKRVLRYRREASRES